MEKIEKIYAEGGDIRGEIRIEFEHRGNKHKHTFTPEEGDWWTSFESNGNSYDVHYDEDYGTISVYEYSDKGTDYSNTVYSKKIMGKGGSTYARGGSLKGHGLAIGDEIRNLGEFGNIYVLNRGVVYMVDLSSGKRTMTKMSKDDAISSFKDGGEVKDDPQVVRYYFEDDEYEYAKGGEVDINDIKIPVHYTMFEDEMYEYGKGGRVSKGEMVWGKLSPSKRMEFLNKHFTPQITPRSQETLVAKNWNFLPKNVKIKFEAIYANIEDY